MTRAIVGQEKSIKSVMDNDRARIFRNSEQRAIDLVSNILKAKGVQKNIGAFDWLRGDTGMRLRVDAYFPAEGLVLEYHGAQHFRASNLMDRRKGRAEQRRRYTKMRQKLIPKHNLKLFEIRYDEPLTHDHIRQRLLRLGYKV